MSDVGLVLLVLLVLALLWRGPKTLPQLGRALGRGVREARREAGDIRTDVERRMDAGGDGAARAGEAAARAGEAARSVDAPSPTDDRAS